MKKLLVAFALSILVLAAGLVVGTALPADASGAAAADPVQPTSGSLAASLTGFSSAYFLGGYCYIECTNGTTAAVRAPSVGSCCLQCANLCGNSCIAESQGPSALCGDL